jgi:hypothetical protein
MAGYIKKKRANYSRAKLGNIIVIALSHLAFSSHHMEMVGMGCTEIFSAAS